MPYHNLSVAVIIPAFNEAKSIGLVVSELLDLQDPLTSSPLVDNLVVCNNASTDQTEYFAKQAGAEVVSEFRKGYGFACLRGIDSINKAGRPCPDVVVFVDGDHSVAVEQMMLLLEQISLGHDLVVGARESGLQEQGSMSPHQQFGNYLASRLIGFLWNQEVTDLGPFRAIRYNALKKLNMQDQTFGWTVEMQVKAIQAKMKYKEIPINSLRRIGVSKISGTVKGTIGAAIGIFSMVFKLYWQETQFLASLKTVSD